MKVVFLVSAVFVVSLSHLSLIDPVLAVEHDAGDARADAGFEQVGPRCADLGETRQPIEFYEQQLKITRDIGDRRGEGNALWNTALALDKLGERDIAIAHAEAALRIREAIEDPRTEKVRQQLAEWKKAEQQIDNG